MLFYETAAVPVHVDMNPPIAQAAEQYFMAEITRANEAIIQLQKSSPNVTRLIHRLRESSSAEDRTVLEDQLISQFEAVLYQGGVPPGMVPPLAQMLVHNTIRDIHIVLAVNGVVYFLCKTVQSLYELGQMIMSGFMHAVFAVAIESRERTTVDVYVRADEFNFRLLCLSSPQHRGLSIN